MAHVLGSIGSQHYKYHARAWRTEHLRKQAIEEVTKMLQAFVPEGFEVKISECDSPVPGFPHAMPYKFRGMLHDPNPEGSDAHFFEGCRKSSCDCDKFGLVVEVLGFDAKVHYTRPASDPDVLEALRSIGYAVRGSAEAWMVIQAAICEANTSFDIPLKIERGRFLAGPVGVSPEHQIDFWRRLGTANGNVLVV